MSVNVSHVKTDKGFLNSGLFALGQMFLLDTTDNSLTELARIELTKEDVATPFSEVRATNVRGIEINGALDVGLKASIEGAVASKAFVEVNNGVRITYQNVYNDITKRIKSEIALGNNVGKRWFLDDAMKKGSPLRLVIAYGAVTANASKVGYDNSAVIGGEIEVPFIKRGTFFDKRGSIRVKVSGSSVEEFEGEQFPVFIDYYVLKVFPNEKGNFDYRVDRDFKPKHILSEALRSL